MGKVTRFARKVETANGKGNKVRQKSGNRESSVGTVKRLTMVKKTGTGKNKSSTHDGKDACVSTVTLQL